MKNGDILYQCSTSKTCKMSVTTDKDGIAVVKTKTQHFCNFEKTERKLKAQPLCVRVLRKSALKKMQERDKTIVEKRKKKLWKRPAYFREKEI